MRLNRPEDQLVRLCMKVVLICALGVAADAQDRHDWQSLGQLQPGDRLRRCPAMTP